VSIAVRVFAVNILTEKNTIVTIQMTMDKDVVEGEKELREKIMNIKEVIKTWVNQMDKVGDWRSKRGMQHYDYYQYEGQKLKDLREWIERQ
jgi:hypothetical protein